MTSSPLRWGLLGTGWIAGKFAKAVLETTTGVLAAAGSRSLETATAFAAKFEIPRAHGSYSALLADPEVDAIYISTPHSMHAEWTIAAARAGKHILCEKPIAMNAVEAEQMAAEAAKAGVFLMEAFMYRCHPFAATAVEIIRSGQLGEVALIESCFGHQLPFNPESRLFNRKLGGGAILDLGCYPASISRLLAGAASGKPFAEPVELTGVARLSPVTGVDVAAAAAVKFENGILGTWSCAMEMDTDSFVRVNGTLGSLKIPRPWHGAVGIELSMNGQPPATLDVRCERSVYALEADAVADAIRDGKRESPFMTVADSIGNMRALDRWLAAVGASYD
ncbi:MAG: Gfo/Idh/MocA family protein [Chthoniobacterales bacterium]